MVVCKYWKQGNCRNGIACRFEHPSNSSGNRPGSFSGGGVFGNSNRSERWHLNEDDIRNDLTNTRPKWILSAYGPGKDAPAALFVDNEYSAEEIRLRFYQAQAAGNAEVADREAIQVWQKAENDMLGAASKVNDIQNFMEQKEKEHPNRYDFCRMDGTMSKDEFAKNAGANTQPGSSINPFGGATGAATSTNPFSKPTFGQASSPFGQPAQTTGFGQQQQQQQQPLAFGKPAQPSAFDKPAFGQSGFGQPAQPSAFGKSPFGQAGFGQTGFNQPKSAFGQPQGQSAFGLKPPEGASAFGQASGPGQNSSSNAFARPSAAGLASNTSTSVGFGQPAFGQTASTNNASPFAQAAGQGNSQSPFANAGTSGSSPFGGINAASPAFGQQGFGQPTQQQSIPAFGQPSQPQQQQPGAGANAFAQKPQQPGFGQSPFGQPQQPQQPQQPGFGRQGFGQQAAQPTPANSSPFGNVQNTGRSPFGNLNTGNSANQSPFGNLNNNANAGQSPFGNLNNASAQAGSNPFGQNNTQQAPSSVTQPTTNLQSAERQQSIKIGPSASKPTSKPVRPLHYSETLSGAPAQFLPNGKLSSYRNLPVQYDVRLRPTATGEEVVDAELPIYQRPDGRGQERIWFPKGAGEATVQRLANVLLDFQLHDDQYTEEVKAEYARLFEQGRFEQGKVPLVPPMQSWVDYDF